MRTRICLLLLLAASTSIAAVKPEQFPWSRILTPPPGAKLEIASAVLDSALFDTLDQKMGNLRLFDQSGREVPYLLRPRALRTAKGHLVALGLPVTFDQLRELDGNRLELIVSREDKGATPAALQLESGIRNFEKLVTVSGSTDRQSWTVLAMDEPIYDYSRYADVRRDTVRFTAARYPWYKIQISNITENKDSPLVQIIRQTRGQNASNETEATSFRREPFRINRLVFLESRATVQTGERETREAAPAAFRVTEDDRKQETTVAFSTLRQPLAAVTLVTDDSNFSRSVRLEGKQEEAPAIWQTLATGRLGRLQAGRISQDTLTLDLPQETRFREYRLVISNLDNPPLAVTGLRLRESLYEAVFFPKAGVSYRLAYGGTDIAAPRYDTASVLAGILAETAETWTLGGAEERAGVRAGCACPFTSARVLTAALIIMAGVLVFFVARLARKVEAD